jgi:acyl carrier protein
MAVVEERIKDLVAKSFNIDRNKLAPGVHFFNDLGADSLLMLSFINVLERKFEVEVSDEDFDNFYCIENIVEFVNTQTAVPS